MSLIFRYRITKLCLFVEKLRIERRKIRIEMYEKNIECENIIKIVKFALDKIRNAKHIERYILALTNSKEAS